MSKRRDILRRLALVLAVCCLSALLCGFTIPSDSWVMDDANILSEETEQFVNEKTKILSDACGAQIGVATVDFTGSLSTADYAYEVANEWGLGDSEKNNGVLLLLVPGADDYRCIQGIGLERTLPTSTLSRILNDELEDNWVAGDYDAGVQATVQALYEELADIYNVSEGTAQGGQQTTEPTQPSNEETGYVHLNDPGAWLNVRQGPGTQYPCVLSNPYDPMSFVMVANGAAVTVLESVTTTDWANPVWLKIRVTYGGKEYVGYSSKNFINIME